MKNNKVALTTWFHHRNYGTALQAVALSEAIKQLGYSVDVVNYKPHGTRYTNDAPSFYSDSERVIDEDRTQKFESFVNNRLSFTKECLSDKDFEDLNDKYHAFVAGSDQVWSPIVFDSRYYLDYVSDNRKKTSYASSFGVTDIKQSMVKERIANLMSQFAHLAVRENTSVSLVKDLIDRTPKHVLDPTLLLDYETWRTLIPRSKSKSKSGKYVLCYFLGDNDNQWLHVDKIAKQHKLQVKIIPTFTKEADHGEFEYGVGPAELFNLIDEADMVLTDSFHGALMAMICSKPFYAFERFKQDDPVSQNSRLYSVLELTATKKQLIKYDEVLRSKYADKVDYKRAHQAINRKREESIKYLKNSLIINQPLVSVVVPMYNVERYIRQCLDSILAQTYKNLEIIVVDDGTPDKSGEIADEYAKKDKRIMVIHKINGGVSTARNAGIDAAKGDFLMFVDSDDVVAPNFVEYMVGLVENTKLNIGTLLNFHNEYSEDQKITPLNDRIDIYEPEKAIEGIYAWFFPLSVDIKIYRRSFIDENKLRFLPELKFAEGMTFNIMALQESGPVAVGKRQLYYQTFNPDSATHTTNIKSWETCFKAYEYQKKHSKIWNDRIDRAHAFHAWLCNSSIARQIYRNGEEKKYIKYLLKYKLKMRTNLLPVLRANISDDQKKRYIHMAFHTRDDLLKINEQEKLRLKNNGVSGAEMLPWDRPNPKPDPIVLDPPEPTEAELLRAQNAALIEELNSMLSIKRSARRLAGNIKRRIKHGSNR